MYGKLTIAASEIPDTRSGIEAEVQTEEVNIRILKKIGEDKKSTDEDVPYPPRKDKNRHKCLNIHI
jgi:hypothetical protein